jgi:hypothetical protein
MARKCQSAALLVIGNLEVKLKPFCDAVSL